MKLPFVAAGSNKEFLGNLILQVIVAYMGLLGYVGMEVAVDCARDASTIKPKIVEHHMSELTIKIKKKSINDLEIAVTFRNIILQVLDSDR